MLQETILHHWYNARWSWSIIFQVSYFSLQVCSFCFLIAYLFLHTWHYMHYHFKVVLQRCTIQEIQVFSYLITRDFILIFIKVHKKSKIHGVHVCLTLSKTIGGIYRIVALNQTRKETVNSLQRRAKLLLSQPLLPLCMYGRYIGKISYCYGMWKCIWMKIKWFELVWSFGLFSIPRNHIR